MTMRLMALPFVNFSLSAHSANHLVILSPSLPGRTVSLVSTAVLRQVAIFSRWAEAQKPKLFLYPSAWLGKDEQANFQCLGILSA